MAHYALLDVNNVVVNVIVGRDETETVDGISDWEAYYSQETGYTAVRTSYNTIVNTHRFGGTPFRYNYAGIGYTFDPTKGTDGAFISPKPFDSWLFNEEDCSWLCPVPLTEEQKEQIWKYTWHEPELSWINIEERPDLFPPGNSPYPEDIPVVE
jgi:hypothetical protein